MSPVGVIVIVLALVGIAALVIDEIFHDHHEA